MTPCNGCSREALERKALERKAGSLCRSCARSAPVLVHGYCGPCGAALFTGVDHYVGGMLAVRTRARAEDARRAQEVEDALFNAGRRSRRNAAMVKALLAKLGVDDG